QDMRRADVRGWRVAGMRRRTHACERSQKAVLAGVFVGARCQVFACFWGVLSGGFLDCPERCQSDRQQRTEAISIAQTDLHVRDPSGRIMIHEARISPLSDSTAGVCTRPP